MITDLVDCIYHIRDARCCNSYKKKINKIINLARYKQFHYKLLKQQSFIILLKNKLYVSKA